MKDFVECLWFGMKFGRRVGWRKRMLAIWGSQKVCPPTHSRHRKERSDVAILTPTMSSWATRRIYSLMIRFFATEAQN